MGGRGSGNRWRSSSSTCEANKRIDLRFLKKQGWLGPDQRYGLRWSYGDEPSGNINYWAYASHLKLEYRSRNDGHDEWQEVEQHVSFDFMPLDFGGQRQWVSLPALPWALPCALCWSKVLLPKMLPPEIPVAVRRPCPARHYPRSSYKEASGRL